MLPQLNVLKNVITFVFVDQFGQLAQKVHLGITPLIFMGVFCGWDRFAVFFLLENLDESFEVAGAIVGHHAIEKVDNPLRVIRRRYMTMIDEINVRC